MSETSAILALPYIQSGQAQKHVTHNEAIRALDLMVQLTVTDRDLTAPPTTPVAGESYIVPVGGQLDWAGQDGNLASFDGTDWRFAVPRAGWRAQVLDEGIPLVFDGTAWVAQRPDLDNLDGLGIGTGHDATNRLAVAADATLLSHDGAGHQLKVNKNAVADTASLLFQSGWSGRAEMGIAGGDDFQVKVSGDGSGWATALSVDAASGVPALPQGATIDGAVTGLAVQQDATDLTAGRLMRADFGYSPGNILGTVSETLGVPTGAVIEQGSDANGAYLRLADGTQICTQVASLGSITATGAGTWDNPYRTNPDLTWTFPAAFVGDPQVHGRGLPPADASAASARRRCLASVGRSNATASYQVCVMRIGSDSTADSFEIELLAIGRWF